MRLVALLVLASVACEAAETAPANRAPAGPAAARSSDDVAQVVAEPYLVRYDFDERLRRFDLPGRLDEISGLAFSPDGRLFAHDDERGRVHEIDPVSGEVGKRFDLGTPAIRDDFEGITIVGERFFLISSTARVYEFREGADSEHVPYRLTDTGLGRDCEVEGLDHDPADDVLLVACKVSTPDRGDIVIHRLPMTPERERLPEVRVPKSALVAWGLEPRFDPSGIAVTPSGSWLIVSGRHDAILEVDVRGAVLGAVELSGGRHPQSEGIAIGPDETLYISDEKNGKDARLTAYGPR